MPTGRARDRVYPRSVGVLGHGFLAEPVMQRLLRALPAATHISAYGRDPDLLAQLQRLGAKTAASPADLAARSEYVLVLLQELDDLEDDLSGSSGLHAGVHSPTILVMGAICTPDDLRNLASELAGKTAGLLRLVDAPLSGTQEPPPAAIFPSWSAPRRVCIVTRFRYWKCSEPASESAVLGSAQIANACEQYVIAATAVALSEAAVIAERAGLDLSRVLHSWELSLAGSRVLGAARAKLLNRDFQPDLPAALRWHRSRWRLNKHGEPVLQRGCSQTCRNSFNCWIERASAVRI